MLPQRLLQSVAVRLISADQRLPLLVLLLVQDPQEVAQLGDGEGIPLGSTEEEIQSAQLFSNLKSFCFIFVYFSYFSQKNKELSTRGNLCKTFLKKTIFCHLMKY